MDVLDTGVFKACGTLQIHLLIQQIIRSVRQVSSECKLKVLV